MPTLVSDEQDKESINQLLGQQAAPSKATVDGMLQEGPSKDQIDSLLGPPAPEAKPRVGTGSFADAAEYTAERLLNIPTGKLSTGFKVAAAEGVGSSLPFGSVPTAWAALKKSFPGLSGDKPTVGGLDLVAKDDPEFAAQWQALKEAKTASQRLNEQTIAKYPPRKVLITSGGEEAEEGPYSQAFFEEMKGGGYDLSGGKKPLPDTPGVHRPPLTDDEIANAGFDLLRARSQQDIEALPGWVKAGIRGVTTGGPLALLQKALPGGVVGGAIVGGAFEAARQGLGIASGEQPSLAPGQILLSSVLFGAGAKTAEGAAETLHMIPKTAAAVGSMVPFEGLGALNAVAELRRSQGESKRVGSSKPENGPGPWQKFGEHIVEGASAMLAGGLVGGHGEERPKDLPSDFKATEVTAKSLKESIFAKLGIRENAPTATATAKETRINNEFVPAEAEMRAAKAKLDRELKKASGGDEALSQKINDWTRVIVESHGNIPVPADVQLPKGLRPVVAAQLEVGKTWLGMNRLLNKYGVISDETMARGEQEGFFFPRSTKGGEIAEEPQPGAARGSASPAPLANPLLQQHLKQRTMSFEEAFADRPLDLSMAKAYEVFRAAAQGGRKAAMLDLSKMDKTLLTKEELPDTMGKEEMRQRAESMNEQIKAKERAIPAMDPKSKLEARTEISAMLAERDRLVAGSEGKLYKKLVGEKYGDKEGMYLARDELSHLNQLDQNHSAMAHLFREVMAIHKQLKAGFNIKAWIQDKISNAEMAHEAGFDSLTGNHKSITKNLGLTEKDALDHQFDVMAERASLGGPTDVSKADLVEAGQLARQIREYEQQGHGTKGLKAVQLLTRRGEIVDRIDKLLTGKSPFDLARLPVKALRAFLSIPRGRQLMIDLADARTAFRNAVEKGVAGSGPLKPGDAFKQIQGVWDYRTLPGMAQGAANYLTWARYPMKFVQSTLTRTAMRKPSLFGKTIPTPMDTVIAADPGSNAAKAALVARGMTRLVTSAVQWLAPLAALQAAAAAHYGIPQKKLDAYLDDRFKYLPDPVQWLVKRTYIPTSGVNPKDQSIDGFDAGSFVPAMVTLRYFSSNSKDAGFWWQLGQKNALVGLGARVTASRDTFGKPKPETSGPWEAASFLLPSFPLNSLEAYARQKNLPPEERSVMRDVARTLVGIPMMKLYKPDMVKNEIERLHDEGLLVQIVGEDGSVDYKLAKPDALTKENALAKAWMAIWEFQKKNDPRLVKLRMERKRQALLDSTGK